MKRGDRVALFRERFRQVIATSGASRSAFARSIGIDRSTLSQLLTADNVRLPRADTIASIAETYQVSIDWLLGLTQEGNLGTDILPGSLEFEEAATLHAHAKLLEWHREAIGYKVRYVPATLPDLLKTEDVLQYEYQGYGDLRSSRHAGVPEDRLAYQRLPESEMEVCQSMQSVAALARGEGVWADLPVAQRRAQLDHMSRLAAELYPGFRWFLFDAREAFSVPFTVFGPLRAVVFMGQLFLVFNSIEHVREFTRRFDSLIRVATVQPTEIEKFLAGLRDQCR